MPHTTLIIGCGDLGTEIALRLIARGDRVIGWRRRPPAEGSPIEFVPVDVTRPVALPHADIDRLVVCLAPRRDGSDDYTTTYLDGIRHVRDACAERGRIPERSVLVSSTAVYGDVVGTVDERTPIPHPTALSRSTGRAAVLLEAERLFADAFGDRGSILRCGGIYGPGRTHLLDRVRAGEAVIPAGSAMTNRIHRDDAAAAIVHLLELDEAAPVYLGVDEEPAEMAEVLGFLADRLGAPRPARGSVTRERGGSRACDSSLLRSTGFRFAYPNYRAGYADMLENPRPRHP